MLPPQKPSSFRVSRRNFLRGVLMGVPAAVALGGPGRAIASMVDTRSIELVNTHTGESLKAAYYLGGGYCEQSLSALDHLLRDFRTGDVATIDPQLYDLLHDVAALADREPRFEVISGFRSPVTNAMLNAQSNGVAKHSLHMEGRAIDVRLQGYRTETLRDLALSLQAGGVGFYRRSDFVHLDTGRVRTWAG
ncbi:MAG: hypothetical protein H6R27_311 [Proteobacteria bacterium]|nr:hypothetical protein [Pseudomonadota bacterium]